MASNSLTSWTPTLYKKFERALALYDDKTPERWQKVGRAVGKSAEEVKQMYQILEEDVNNIEAGRIPFPIYRTN